MSDVMSSVSDYEGCLVEWGPKGKRKRGAVVATRETPLDSWSWINPGVNAEYAAAPASRAPNPADDAKVIVQVLLQESVTEGRSQWREPELTRFGAPKIGALTVITRPASARSPRTSKAGRSKRKR